MRDRGVGTRSSQRSARAALRETWEEARVLFGRPAERARRRPPVRAAIERAYLERGLVAAMDVLTYVGRAITPSHSARRFNTRFFLGDGSNVFGEPAATEELEDVGWHPIGREALDLVPRRDAVHAGARDRAPRRHRERCRTALLLGQERPPHRRVPRERDQLCRTREEGEMATDGDKISLAVLAGDGKRAARLRCAGFTALGRGLWRCVRLKPGDRHPGEVLAR